MSSTSDPLEEPRSPASSVSIRAGSVSDVPHLERIERLSMDTPWSGTDLREETTHPHSHLLVASVDQTEDPVGYLALRRVGDEAEVLRLAVEPSHRNRGIGGELLRKALDILVSEGVRSCFLEVREDNDAALRLYRRFSFRVFHRRPGYYRDGCSAVVLATAITESRRVESP